MSNPTFSLITPAYNNPEEVRKLLDSIRPEAMKDKTLEAIVVDDCSKDRSLEKVVNESGFATYLRMDSNSGPAAARNAGAKAARNEILIFLDSDVILNSDTLSRIRDKFSMDRDLAIFGGEYDIEPANPSLSTKFKSLMVRSWSPRKDMVTVFLTRLGAIRRDIFFEFGGFDTNLKTAAVEDYELGRRLMSKGHAIHYDPAVTVKHHFPTFKKQIGLFFHRAFMWIYILKKYRKFDNTCTTPLLGLAQAFGFLSALSLVLAAANMNLIYLSLLFLALFIVANARFFGLVLKYEGPLFMLAAIPMALVISCSIVMGSACGIVYYTLMRKD